MKMMKKLASVALALVMVLCLTTTAFATKIEIKNPVTSGTDGKETYKAYKIFDVVIPANEKENENDPITYDPNAPHSYTIDSTSPFFEAVNGSDIFELEKVGETTTYNVKLVADNTAETGLAISQLLGAVADKGTPAATTSEANGDDIYTLELTTAGYYLITSTLGSNMIVDTVGAGETLQVNAKNDYPTLKKTIEDISNNGTVADEGKAGTAAYGSTVTFKIDVNVPASAVGEMIVHDFMDDQLTYVENSLSANVTLATTLEEDAEVREGYTHRDFIISEDTVAANLNGTVTIKYTATLKDGVPVDTAIKNIAHLTYSTYKTPDVEVEVYTYEFDLVKTTSEATGNKILTGAKFDLYKVVGEEDVLVKEGIEVGTATISGLSAGNYKLIETEAPAGYNKLKEPVPFEIKVKTEVETENGIVTEGGSLKATFKTEIRGEGDEAVEVPTAWEKGGVHVENYTGAELPSTGGIGTTIFYIVGGILVVGAGILLVTKKRVGDED